MDVSEWTIKCADGEEDLSRLFSLRCFFFVRPESVDRLRYLSARDEIVRSRSLTADDLVCVLKIEENKWRVLDPNSQQRFVYLQKESLEANLLNWSEHFEHKVILFHMLFYERVHSSSTLTDSQSNLRALNIVFFVSNFKAS